MNDNETNNFCGIFFSGVLIGNIKHDNNINIATE